MGGQPTRHPMLDREALEEAAASAMARVSVDLPGALRLVAERRRRIRHRLAAAAAVLLVVLALTPLAVLATAVPASVPSGPARLPASVTQAPVWIPTATESPIGRALLVVQPDRFWQQAPDATPDPVLVGADGEGYRRLPSGGRVWAVALSPDGRQVAWVEDTGQGVASSRARVLDLHTGRIRGQDLTGRFGRGVRADTLTFSPDGTRLALGGYDEFAGGAAPAVYLLDAATGRVAGGCACGTAGQGVAWSADGRVLTAVGAPGVPGGGVMPAHDGSYPDGGEPDASQPSNAVSATGTRRYWVKAASAEREPLRHLVSSALDGTSRQVADLGRLLGAVALADSPRGVLVARWRSGGGDLAAVRGDGRLEVLTRSSGPVVVAAAAGLMADARSAPGIAAPAGWQSPSWYRWEAGRAIGHGLVGLLLVVLVVAALLFSPVWRFAGWVLAPLRAGGSPVLAGAAAVGAVALVAGFTLPTVARPPSAPADGSGSPVLPSVVRRQALLPPPAFDAPGQPRTRRISMVFGASYGGEKRLIGVDGDTGTLVRLDHLPGVPRSDVASSHLTDDRSGDVSPNGRYVALGPVVIDLQTATARTVAEAGQSPQAVAVTDDGTLLAVVSGMHRVTIAPPGQPARTLAGSEGTFALEPGGGGLVLTRFFLDSPRPHEELVDVIDPATGRYLGPLTGLEQSVPAVVVGTDGSTTVPAVVSVSPQTGELVRRGEGPATVTAPGSVEALTVGANGGLAAFGYGGPSAPHAVLRSSAGGGALQPLTTMQGSDLAGQVPALAGEVIGRARVVDVAPPRWDGQVGLRVPLQWVGAGLVGVAAIAGLPRSGLPRSGLRRSGRRDIRAGD